MATEEEEDEANVSAVNQKGKRRKVAVDPTSYEAKIEKVRKRREQKKEQERPIKHTKIHISNLSPDTTNEDLFAGIGRIKRAFTITKHGSTVCNGQAFVIFEDEQTAKRAARLNGLKHRGRKLNIEMAIAKHDSKAKREIKSAESSEAARPNKKRVFDDDDSGVSDKPGPVKKRPKLDEKRKDRIVEVTGMKFRIDEKALYQDFKRLKLCTPVQVEKKDDKTIQILFVSPQAAVTATEKLNGYKYKNCILHASMQGTVKLQNCRVIVRNLAYKCTTEDLREAFTSFGKITEVSIPTNVHTGKPAGYGFVQFIKQKDAAKAVESVQAKEIKGRMVAVDFAVAASEYLKAKVNGKENTNGKANEEEGSESGGGSEDEEGGSNDGEAHHHDDDDDDDNMESSGAEDEEISGDDDSEEGENEDDDMDGDMDMNEDEDEDGEGGGEEEEEEEEMGEDEKELLAMEEEFRFSKYDEEMGLFVRNLSFETTQKDVEKFFSQFGPLKYAVLVMNKETNTSKGCAFVRFRNGDDGIKLLDQYQETNPPAQMVAMYAKDKKDDNKKGAKKGDKKVLIPTRSVDGTFVLGGRQISLHPAVPQDQVRDDRRDTKKLVRNDARNLQLARMSNIKDLNMTDYTPDEKRIYNQLLSERNRQLKNSNVHVSPLRMVVNNLPFKIKEEDLRKFFLQKGQVAGKPAKIRQVKILKDTQTKRSRGFGFVEFYDHQNAKQAVKNTNGKQFEDFSGNRIFTSFTLDDARKRQQADKLAKLRRSDALKKLKSNPEYTAKLKDKKFRRKMKKLEQELSQKE